MRRKQQDWSFYRSYSYLLAACKRSFYIQKNKQTNKKGGKREVEEGKKKESIGVFLLFWCSRRFFLLYRNQNQNLSLSPYPIFSKSLGKKGKKRIQNHFLHFAAIVIIVIIKSHLGAFEHVAVRVPEERRGPPARRRRVRDAGRLKPLHDGSDAPHADAEVPVAPPVRGPALRGIGRRELHEVDHLSREARRRGIIVARRRRTRFTTRRTRARTDPQPRAAVWELVVGAVRVELEAEDAPIKLERSLEVRDEEADVVEGLEEWRRGRVFCRGGCRARCLLRIKDFF